MGNEIRIEKKSLYRGDDGQKVISIRISNDLAGQLDNIAVETNRSRNDVINLMLKSAVSLVKVEEKNVDG